ncbi:MAG TPA: DUF1850 domain-containing protein [Burkholderiales bacterium]|nr:DUF1850 domain-containing protein [Burkholderiales bacterium]
MVALIDIPTWCIALAAGASQVILPAPKITLGWTHTVERTRWEEDYAASAGGVKILEARIEAFGAGMEPPASAVRRGKWWHYRPALPTLREVSLANSSFAGGYSVCWNGACRPLNSIVPGGRQVAISARRCTSDPPQHLNAAADIGAAGD